jgi:site-specific DNA-methyltransferase (adenine-specific)
MTGGSALGRWPANLCHDGSEEVVGMFPNTPGQHGDLNETGKPRPIKIAYGDMGPPLPHMARGDSGSAARFFYCSKADSDDRAGSKHPTVKPVDLMRWLVRLVTPKGGTVLDPFAGTGTTGQAALMEGMKAVLIEQSPEYVADIERRLAQPIQIGGLV